MRPGRQTLIDRSLSKCEKAGCSEEKQKEHMRLYVDGWDVHPPEEFIKWWAEHEQSSSAPPVLAWNIKRYRDEFQCVPEADTLAFRTNPQILAAHRARVAEIRHSSSNSSPPDSK